MILLVQDLSFYFMTHIFMQSWVVNSSINVRAQNCKIRSEHKHHEV